MKGEKKMSVEMKLIGTLHGNRVFKSVVESAFSTGVKKSKGIGQIVNFKFVNSKGQVTKEVQRYIADKSSLSKTVVHSLKKDGFAKKDLKSILQRYEQKGWNVNDMKNGTKVHIDYNIAKREINRELLKGDFRDVSKVVLSPNGKSVDMYARSKTSTLFPHLDSYVEKPIVKDTPWTSLIDFLKTH